MNECQTKLYVLSIYSFQKKKSREIQNIICAISYAIDIKSFYFV